MQNSLLWECLQVLKPEEHRRLEFFLQSPYFNRREDVCRLYTYLLDCLKQNRAPEPQEIYPALYPNRVFDLTRFRLVQSYLNKLVEEFLCWEEVKNEELPQLELLPHAYRKRGLSRHFHKALRQQQKLLEKIPLRHPEHHLHRHRLEREKFLMQSRSGRSRALNLREVNRQLDLGWISVKLRQACLTLSHQTVFRTDYELLLLPALLKVAQRADFIGQPAVALYYYCYQALTATEPEPYFLQLKDHLFRHAEAFPQSEIRDLLLLAINFCIKRINANEQKYLEEALSLYRLGLEEGILLENNRLSRFTFNNTVGIAIRLQAYYWTETFLDTFSPYLHPDDRDMTYHLGYARLDFARGHYQQALVHLQNADYRDLIHHMVAKTLQMKTYYELEEYDLLDAHLHSMQMFVRRNRKTAYHHRNWSNIIRYCRKLLEVNPYDREAREELMQAIQKENELTEKEWLLEKLA